MRIFLRVAVAALLAPLSVAPLSAQTVARPDAATSAPNTGAGAEAQALPDPAAAPPAPATLSAQPGKARVVGSTADFRDIALPSGIAALPGGGWRLTGAASTSEPERPQAQALVQLARALAQRTEGRVTVLSQVAGPANDLATARRDSLAQARALKARLVAAGLPDTRIDLRPLGLMPAGRILIDLLPPATPLPAEDLRP
ncbi:hypothetical protein [Roseomonas elaeocarpi]|uniref:OmpA-like domain-containing protein n=1 Tax=Roseomonas elaeocarpi TaxID=907779 RepID=A0ABV6JRY5_9PROT